MNENEQAGVISVCTAFHETRYSYVRQINGGNIVEEIHDLENPGEYEEVYHGTSIDLDRNQSNIAALCV